MVTFGSLLWFGTANIKNISRTGKEVHEKEGTGMTEVFRRIKNNNYTVMCNHHLQNEHLSLKAMGLMSKLLSLPDDWNYSVRGIAAICKDGYESVRTAFLELEKEGYIVRRRIRDQRGHIIRTEYYILETPDTKIPEESEGAKETLPASAKMEASEEKKMADKQEKEKEYSVHSPGSDFPTVGKKSEGNLPGSDFPTFGNTTVDSPGSDFPTTENRHQQNTIITKYNKYNISSSSKINNILTPKPLPEEEESKERIKDRIGYEDLLAAGYDHELLDEILVLLETYGIRGKNRPAYTYIGQSKVSAAQITDRLQRIDRDQVQNILQRMQNGPEIRNLKSYLLTALYQADLTTRLNKQRKEHGYAPPIQRNAFSNFHQREYDYGKLEQAFLKNAADEQQ